MSPSPQVDVTQDVASRRSLLRLAAGVGAAVTVAPVVHAATAEAAVRGVAASPALRASSGRRRARRCRVLKKRGATRAKIKAACRRRKKRGQSTATTTTPVKQPGASTNDAKAAKPPTSKPPTPKPPTPPKTPTTPKTPATPPPAATPLAAAPMLDAADRHLMSRFAYDVDRAQADQVLAAGGGVAWFEDQLTATGTDDPATAGLLDWWPSLSRPPLELWNRQVSNAEQGSAVMADYQRYLLIRRVRSTRPVLDMMAEFWENHFNVSVGSDKVFPHRVSYGAALRAQALGRFEDLLLTATTHPAMLIYLDGAVSTKTKPNENLGRELLELHTVGLGEYGEDDVKNSARILTGYRVEMSRTWLASYQPGDHFTGPVSVMGFASANTAADGRPVTEAYLRYLAHHPATARRIARKLAIKFVHDNPSSELVDQLAQVYLDHDTAIPAVLRALVASSEFAESAGAKMRDPVEDVIATYRTLGVAIAPPVTGRPNGAAEKAILAQAGRLGLMPHGWPRPDGSPIDNDSWCSTARVLASLELHLTMCAGSNPRQGITFRTPAEWLPSAGVTFSDLVEHLSREILHVGATPDLHRAAELAVGASATEVIWAGHPVVKSTFARLLTTVLDSPLHMKR